MRVFEDSWRQSLYESFRRMGMPEAGARAAAVGRQEMTAGSPYGSAPFGGDGERERIAQAVESGVSALAERELADVAQQTLRLPREKAEAYARRVAIREANRGADLVPYLRGVAAALREVR